MLIGLAAVGQTVGTAPAASPAPAAAGAAVAVPKVDPKIEKAYNDREKGMRALGDRIFSAAARFFLEYREVFVGQEPEFADATTLLVKAYLLQGKVEEAATALSFHASRSKGLTEPYYVDALTYWHGAVLHAQGKWADAAGRVAGLAAATRTPEYQNLALELLGDASAMLSDWTRSEAAFTQLLRDFPEAENALRARLGLAKVYLATRQTAKAASVLAALQESHDEAPLLTLTLFRVLLGLQEGRLDEALRLYRGIAAERPQKADTEWWTVSSQLAGELLAAERHEDALEILPQVLVFAVSETERVQTLLRRAEALIALEKVEQAITALEEFRKTYAGRPELIPVQVRLAELLRRTKNFMTASKAFGEVADNLAAPPPFRYRAALSRGWCYRDAGQFDQAVEAFAKAEALGLTDQQKAEAVFLAGDTAFLVENYTLAIIHYSAVADHYADTSFAQRARLRQARSSAKAKLFASAARVYKQFLADFPESELTEDATLECGVVLKNAGDNALAMKWLTDFVAAFPESPHAPRALIESYQAAVGADYVPEALERLTLLIEKYPDSDFYPHAIQKRASVRFFQGNFEGALADCELFLSKFILLPMATDVLVWLGDHYANHGDLEKSEGYFLRLVTTHPQSSLAPMALYEAAKSAYRGNDLTRAALLLVEFGDKYAEAAPKIRAQTAFLQGDILATEGKYAEAAPHFAKARGLAGDTRLGFAALGRLGEMHYSQSAADSDGLQQGIECFQAIVGNELASDDMKEMARYRLGKCYEKLANHEAAIKAYLDVYYQYQIDITEGRLRDWFYFARSGYDAARLLVMKEQFREAARIYERLGESRIPTAADALHKAREIRDTHDLHD